MRKAFDSKGFSLVELIIVIAIMAILAAAISPALIRYINKAKKADDIATADAVGTALMAAITENESLYDYVVATAAQDKNKFKNGQIKYRVIGCMNAGTSTHAFRLNSINNTNILPADEMAEAQSVAGKVVGDTMGAEYFKLKFTCNDILDQWLIAVDDNYNFAVFATGHFNNNGWTIDANGNVAGQSVQGGAGSGGNLWHCYQLWPEVDPLYQELNSPKDAQKYIPQ